MSLTNNNSSLIAVHTGQITVLQSVVSNHETRVTSLETTVADHGSRITDNEAHIAALFGGVGDLRQDMNEGLAMTSAMEVSCPNPARVSA